MDLSPIVMDIISFCALNCLWMLFVFLTAMTNLVISRNRLHVRVFSSESCDRIRIKRSLEPQLNWSSNGRSWSNRRRTRSSTKPRLAPQLLRPHHHQPPPPHRPPVVLRRHSRATPRSESSTPMASISSAPIRMYETNASVLSTTVWLIDHPPPNPTSSPRLWQ